MAVQQGVGNGDGITQQTRGRGRTRRVGRPRGRRAGVATRATTTGTGNTMTGSLTNNERQFLYELGQLSQQHGISWQRCHTILR
jgi:hypothetical protein